MRNALPQPTTRHIRAKNDFPSSRSRSRSRNDGTSSSASSKNWRRPRHVAPAEHRWTAFAWVKDINPLACTVACAQPQQRQQRQQPRCGGAFVVDPATVLSRLDSLQRGEPADAFTESHIQSTLSQECGIIDQGDFGAWAPLTVPRLIPPRQLRFQNVTGCVCDGAGILPVMQPPHSNCLYFVLGCQTFDLDTPLAGGRWTLFGGGQHRGETDTAATAAREFLEESMGVIQWQDGLRDVPSSAASLARCLRNHDFVMCCRLRYVRDGLRRFYDVFVRRIPWDPALPARFDAFRTSCVRQRGRLWRRAVRLHHPALHPTTHALRPPFAELSRLGIWSRQQLVYATRRSGGLLFDQSGNAMHCRTAVMPILALCLQQLDVMEEHATSKSASRGALSHHRGSVGRTRSLQLRSSHISLQSGTEQFLAC